MPCAPMDSSLLELGADSEGAFVRLTGEREYIRGFGSHYIARPSVTMRPASSLFDIAMHVKNVGGAAMDLMYMCHVNPVFVADARIVQPAPWTPESVVARTAVPGHVVATPEYLPLSASLPPTRGRPKCCARRCRSIPSRFSTCTTCAPIPPGWPTFFSAGPRAMDF